MIEVVVWLLVGAIPGQYRLPTTVERFKAQRKCEEVRQRLINLELTYGSKYLYCVPAEIYVPSTTR